MRRTLFLLLLIVTPLLAVAQAPDFDYLPEKFGVSLGWEQQQVLGALQDQGFSFQPGGTHTHLRGARDSAGFFDFILVVAESHGSVAIWQTDKVILGFKGGQLALVQEMAQFEGTEAETVYDELLPLFDAALTQRDGHVLPANEWTREQRQFSERWQEFFWFAAFADGTETGRGRSWRDGRQLTALTVQPFINAAGQPSERRKVVLIQHIDWCAFPELNSFLDDGGIDCRAPE